MPQEKDKLNANQNNPNAYETPAIVSSEIPVVIVDEDTISITSKSSKNSLKYEVMPCLRAPNDSSSIMLNPSKFPKSELYASVSHSSRHLSIVKNRRTGHKKR